jgi:hypothetical protein
MNAEELDFFYRRIGAALWHIQYLEDVLVTFLVAVLVEQRRSSGESVAHADGKALLAQKRKVTLGPLIQSCISKKVIPPPLHARFDQFKEERHWLVHRSMVESGDELYSDAARDAVFRRIMTVQQEAIALKKLVVGDFESWMAARGVDPQAAQRMAEESIQKLKDI